MQDVSCVLYLALIVPYVNQLWRYYLHVSALMGIIRILLINVMHVILDVSLAPYLAQIVPSVSC